MATLEEKLCPVCFQEAMEGGKCQNCGYVLDKASVGENHLKPFSILNTKYLLGKSLGQGGFGITYLAKNMSNGSRCCIKEYFPSNLIQSRMPDGTVALTGEENRCEFEDRAGTGGAGSRYKCPEQPSAHAVFPCGKGIPPAFRRRPLHPRW